MAEQKGKGKKKQIHEHVRDNSSGGVIYGLGIIGAAIYYFQGANNFWEVILGILKAIVWPAFIVYHLHRFLGL